MVTTRKIEKKYRRGLHFDEFSEIPNIFFDPDLARSGVSISATFGRRKNVRMPMPVAFRTFFDTQNLALRDEAQNWIRELRVPVGDPQDPSPPGPERRPFRLTLSLPRDPISIPFGHPLLRPDFRTKRKHVSSFRPVLVPRRKPISTSISDPK